MYISLFQHKEKGIELCFNFFALVGEMTLWVNHFFLSLFIPFASMFD